MKILLIDPNIEEYALMPSLSLAYLKGFISSMTRHEAKIVDLVFHKNNWKKILVKKISDEKPDLIGFSVLSFNCPQALRMAQFIKQNFSVKIIFGGVHVILSPEKVIENEEVDIVCTGEGEETLKELLDNNLDCTGIKGIWYKQNGKIIKNENRTNIENLNALAFPDFEDFNIKRYFEINNNHLPILASRGCPYKCSYCSNHALSKKLKGKYVRVRSADNVIEEIELRLNQFKKEGLKYLYFYDDTFILYGDFVADFCKKFKAKEFHKILKWTANVRANLVTDEVIKTMKGAGCYEARMGVEAGNDYIRNTVYKRNMTKEQIFKAFQIIKNNGLQLRLYFIFGAPYETAETMEDSYCMAKKSNADLIFFTELLLLPGTEIKKICEKEKLVLYDNDKAHLGNDVISIGRTKFVSGRQMKRFAQKIRRWQTRQYIRDGLDMNGAFFILDYFLYLFYYKHKYNLGLNQAYRWTIQRYKLKKV